MNNYKKYDTQVSSSQELHPNSSWKMMFDMVEEGRLVLDVGCATGYLGKMLIKEKNCTVVGIDINPDVYVSVKDYYEKFFVTDLDSTVLSDLISDLEFDVIIFGDVLEHLKDPWRVLKESHKILNSDGYVIASIPNISHGSVILSLLQGNFEYSKYGILDNTHLRFFTRASVLNLFKECGFCAEIANYTEVHYLSNSELIPYVDISKFSVEVLELISNYLDVNVLQFIIKAYPNLFAQLQSTQQELVQTQSQLQFTQQELAQTQSQLQSTQQELEQVKNEISLMQRSKFWKMRNLWFRLKSLLSARLKY